jgi:hypothetical protein
MLVVQYFPNEVNSMIASSYWHRLFYTLMVKNARAIETTLMITMPCKNRRGRVDCGSQYPIVVVLMTITKGHCDHIGVVHYTIKVRLFHGITTEKEESH